jgi:hypothetical protein
MAVEYVQCRLTADTHRRLTSLAAEMRVKAKKNPDSFLPGLTQGKAGLSVVVDQLIFWHDAETARKRSYGPNRRREAEEQLAETERGRMQPEQSVAPQGDGNDIAPAVDTTAD